ncbi:MAG: outer membrane protein assembly factor, partial [Bacteroidota bacterium]|nr:outer membrane protein assembly factor [Bacteroidota bacterium]MDX5431924.1 outer membrane protein assembly factor [Bacteroidota bacterium]MDX5470642.1 outer membrane protein assembly factor [Bacteroidota bacterium]
GAIIPSHPSIPNPKRVKGARRLILQQRMVLNGGLQLRYGFMWIFVVLGLGLKAQVSFIAPGLFSKNDSLKKEHKEGIILFPILYYTPDTRLGYGATGVYHFYSGKNYDSTRLSYFKILADYTQNKQLDVWSSWNIFTKYDKMLFKGEARYRIFPDRYYGIGNRTALADEESFEYSLFSFKFLALKRFFRSWYIGADVNFDYEFNFKLDPERALAKGDITGYRGGTTVGAGLVATWDTRDNPINAYSGQYLQFTSYFNSGALGSDFNYNRYTVEYRGFKKLGEKSVLALNVIGQFTSGQVPFLDLPRVGSDQLLRGYASYRYRDRHRTAMQVEYRFPLFWRLGAVAFAGLGDVYDSPKDVSMSSLKYSYGGGLRLNLNRTERINLRLDYGWGRNSSAFYLAIIEAF